MNRPEPETPAEPPSGPILQALVVLMLIAVTLAILMTQRAPPAVPTDRPVQITYTEFKQLVEQRRVERVTMRGHELRGELHASRPLGTDRVESARFETRVPAIGDAELLSLLEAGEVAVAVEDDSVGVFGQLLLVMLPMALLVLLLLWLFRRTASRVGGQLGGRGELDRFLDTSTRQAEVPKVRFSDVAGQENAKRDVSELVECLRNPEAFNEIGAEIPRGVLMMGPPGTGKTLMARALAGEAEVPFYSVSGSEFIEVYVGVGASRVRRLFEQAKRNAPSIVFIDELDSIGRTRGTGLGGGHDEREQTLNQILAEMDGFTGHEAVIVLAATNRPDVLDPALLRPGRFDRQVTIGLPTMREREDILKVHVRNKPVDEEVDLRRLAESTPMFSGADLENLTNEAALIAARANKHVISWTDFNEALDRITLGLRRGSLVPTEQERRLLAYHEAGHAVAFAAQSELGEIRKVTISPRGGAGGFMAPLSKEELFFNRECFNAQLIVAFGGRVAEKRITGTISSGASNDLKQATEMAKQMVLDLGMGGEEYVAWGSDAGPVFLGGEISRRKDFSEETARQLEEEVTAILKVAYERTHTLIDAHWPAVEAVARALLRVETVDGKLVAEAYRRAESGEDTEAIAEWIVGAVEEQERRVQEANEKQKAKAEEREREEAARAAPPTSPPPSRPATEGSGS